MASKRISEQPKKELFEEIKAAVKTAYQNNGDKQPEPAEAEFLINGLMDYVWEYHPGYRAGELKKAIDLGSAGHYGEFWGLNKRSFTKFILEHVKAYPVNQEAKVATNAQASTSQRPGPEQEFKRLKQITIDAYNRYQTGKIVNSYGIVYKFLTDFNFLKLTKEQKQEIYTEATEFINLQESQPKSTMKDFISQALGHASNLSAEARILSRAKEQSVIKFFKEFNGDMNLFITNE